MSAPSSLSASTKRAVARIRRLCCLGLGGEITVPALLGELPALIPSFWVPAMGRKIVRHLDEGGEGLDPLIREVVEKLRGRYRRGSCWNLLTRLQAT